MSSYTLLASDPYGKQARISETKAKKGVKAMKTPKTTNITEMNTARILLYVAYRHRVGILIMALVLSWIWFIATGLPPAIHNVRG